MTWTGSGPCFGRSWDQLATGTEFDIYLFLSFPSPVGRQCALNCEVEKLITQADKKGKNKNTVVVQACDLNRETFERRRQSTTCIGEYIAKYVVNKRCEELVQGIQFIPTAAPHTNCHQKLSFALYFQRNGADPACWSWYGSQANPNTAMTKRVIINPPPQLAPDIGAGVWLYEWA